MKQWSINPPHGLYFHMHIQQLESLKHVNWVLRYLEGIESYIRLHSLFLLLVGGGGGGGGRGGRGYFLNGPNF